MKPLRILVLILCVGFVSVAWGGRPASTCSNNWSEYVRSNMERWNPCEKTLNVHNVSRLVLKWNSINSGGTVVVDGVAFVAGFEGRAFALNASTGALLWSSKQYGNMVGSPAVANGVVYVGSTDSNVYALDARTGVQLWSYRTGSSVESSPTVANGVVYIGSNDGNLYALDARTGAKVWSYQGVLFVQSSPAVKNGVVYFGSAGNVYALNAATGALLWTYATGTNDVLLSLVVTDGAVYISSYGDETVYALNASNGALLWTFFTPIAPMGSPAVADGVVYVGCYHVYALDASSGAVLWTSPLKSYWGNPAVANGVVYVPASKVVYALNARTGATLWDYKAAANPDVTDSPVVSKGIVYFNQEYLYAFGLK
jgi:outer membrane protein assembly factor BamB